MDFKVCRKEDIPKKKQPEKFGEYDRTIDQIEKLSVECVKIETNKRNLDRIRNGMSKACKRRKSMYQVCARGTTVYVYMGNM